MSYDITFCEGVGCGRKETCHRYCELQRYREDKDPDKETLISMTKPTGTNACTMFWPEKGGEQ